MMAQEPLFCTNIACDPFSEMNHFPSAREYTYGVPAASVNQVVVASELLTR